MLYSCNDRFFDLSYLLGLFISLNYWKLNKLSIRKIISHHYAKYRITPLLMALLLFAYALGFAPQIFINTAVAQEAEFAVDYRRSLMFNIQNNLRGISNILKGELSHQDHLQGLAFQINLNAKQADDAFKANLLTKKSQAKSAIWEDYDNFSLEMQSFIRETDNLVKLAESNDIQAFKAQFGVVGKTCSSCHRKYKNR